MEILEIKEQEDGSALVTLDLTREEQRLLIEKGFNTVLIEYIEKEKRKKNGEDQNHK